MSRALLIESVLQADASDFLRTVDGARVQVNVRDSGAATVYRDQTGTATWGNPLTTRNGRIEPTEQAGAEAWLNAGSYDLAVSVGAQSHASTFEALTGSDLDTVQDATGVVASAIYADPIQGAIDAAVATGARKVVIPPGTWNRPSAATIPNYVEVEGHGQSTIVRCTDNNYAFSFAPGNRSRVSNLQIDAANPQTGGGGLDYTNAGSNTRVENLYFGSNLYTAVNLCPAAVTTVHMFDCIRWNGVSGCNTAFRIGDGANLVTDVSIRRVKGTAATAGDMATWFDVAKNVDTLTLDDVLVIKGGTGMVLGSRGAGGAVTGLEADQLVIDTMTAKGIDSVGVKDATFGESCMIQTCGTAAAPGLHAQPATLLLRYTGTIRQCGGDGVLIEDGSKFVRIKQAEVYDNNTTNTATLANVHVAANADFFEITDCLLGNNVALTTGHAKHGIRIDPGDSNQFVIGVNFHHRHETSPLSDGSTGQLKTILPQYAVDAAGTAAVAVDQSNFGSLYIRDTGGVQRLRLLNSGVVDITAQFAANYLLSLDASASATAPALRMRRGSTLKSQINSQGAFVSDDAAQGIVLKDAQATPHYWRVTVSNAGVVTTADLGTTRPD